MGRGEATLAPPKREITRRAERAQNDGRTPEQRFRDFQREKINVLYVDSPEMAKQAVAHLRKLNPSQVGLDFETASKNGQFGSTNGSLRLIQIGVDEPERGIRPQQIIVDCHATDPAPFAPLLRTSKVEKQIHYMDFEQEWAQLHLGVSIGNIYDTCIASQVIQKRLAEMDPAEVEEIVPGWEKHNNKLSTLTLEHLGMEMPKDDQASDWGRPELHSNQVVYAATDAAMMLPLTRRLKEIAEKIGCAKQIDGRIAWVKGRINERVERTQRSKSDDSVRLIRSIRRAASVNQLEKIRALGRQMTVFAPNAAAVQQAYEEQLGTLSPST